MAMKKEQFETAVKWVGGVGLVLVVGGVAVAVLTSLAAIAAAGALGLVMVNGWPVLSTKLANWRYRALRNAAIENPMPTLIRAYDQAVARYKEKRQGVTMFATTIGNFKAKIESYKKRAADTTSMEAMYENMKRALAVQVQRLSEQQRNLEEAKVVLAETQDKYNMALDMQTANSQLEDFTGETGMDFALQREAFDAVTAKLNEGFARMEISMQLDYNALPNAVQQSDAISFSTINQQLKETEFA
jgi:hypothetical protein